MSEDKPTTPYRGRLAPTPSGYLHKGHILTFRTAWGRARAYAGKLLFRMDDLDPDRCTAAYATACIEDMRGMGLDWDEGPYLSGPSAPYEQSKRSSFYIDAMKKLYQQGLIYPCSKSRKDIRAHGLLDTTGNEYLYPESFRSPNTNVINSEFPGTTNWRFLTYAGKKVEFLDAKKAGQSFLVGKDLSDFLVWRKGGFAAYELATVVDDYFMGITEVVRGEDLLLSSARQCLLFDALSWKRPSFYHCEILLDADGNKLSKSARTLPRLFSTS